ncbi:hypothetical protein RCL1_007448 [Eukaryota sp. TZLM3-RCL]
MTNNPSSTHFVGPRLSDVRADSVTVFLKDYAAYVKSAGLDARNLRDCIEESLLECFYLLNPSLKKSDSELKRYLEGLTSYNSIEDAYLDLDALRMDLSISDPHARVFKLLQEFMGILRRSKVFGLSEKSLLPHFASAVKPYGLSQSLLSRISDGILSSLSGLVAATIADLTDFERVMSWKRPHSALKSHTETPDVKRPRRSEVFSKKLCFKCNESGHYANECPKHTNRINFIAAESNDKAPAFISNPLSLFEEKK